MKFLFRKPSTYIIILGIFLRIFNALYIPKFASPDEQPHYKYIQFIYKYHELPKIVSKTKAPTRDWEYYQPPLYYTLLSPLQYFGETAGFYLARFFSVLLFVLMIFLIQKILKNLRFSEFRKTIVNSIFCFLPTYVFTSPTINNDNLLIFLSVLMLYILTLVQTKNTKYSIGILLGLAVLTKLSAVVLFVTVFSYYYFVEKNKFSFKNFLMISIIAIGMSFPFFVRNWLLYHSLTAENLVNEICEWVSVKQFFIIVFGRFMQLFWAVAGRVNDVKPSLYYLCYPFFAVFSIAFFLYKKMVSKEKIYPVAFYTLAFNFLLVLYAGYQYSQAQGRFIFFNLFFVSYFFAIALEFLFQKTLEKKQKYIAGIFIFMLLITNFTVYQKFEELKKTSYRSYPAVIFSNKKPPKLGG